ncbi:MAG TPA: HAD family hydrolase [Spirochaetota bacterium]|nr:HAD family hydrolase [Spirochaetota bacterium]HNU90808.1 HAD family hydrolase [Spirochaetota bacterium]HPV97401.1 HAD family hydrolase [Spirochaetota bacterium]
MNDSMKYDALVFDLDGTLLDTLRDIADSVNAALEAEGLAGHPAANYRLMVGNGMDVLVERAVGGRLGDNESLVRCMERARIEYARRYNNATRPYDGIPQLLGALSARGLRLAVLSNKPDEYTVRIIREYLDGYFEIVRGLRPDFPRKPDPAQALDILASMGVAPSRCLMVGDSGGDMKTALGAGMVPVGVLWGFRDREELKASGAHALLERPDDLLSLL